MKKHFFVVLILISVMFGCKSAKSISTNGTLDNTLTANQLIRENSKNEVRFKTLQAKVKIDFQQGDHSQGHSVTLRIEKDKTIWISATLGLVRAKITPDNVKFYTKLSNEYFDGDYALLSDLLGIELNYEKLENLLLGEAIFKLKKGDYTTDIHEQSYALAPKNKDAALELFYLLNPSHFKIDSQQLYQPDSQRLLQVDYKAYQEANRQIVPKKIHIKTLDRDSETTIDLQYKSVSLNEDVRFPFKIPSGYKEIQLK